MITKVIPLGYQYIPNLLKVTLVKSSAKCNPQVKASLDALGMTKLNKHRYHKNSPEIRGMIYKAARYVQIEEIPLDPNATSTSTTN